MDRDITPTGKFRLGINGENRTLYTPGPDGSVGGISADLGAYVAGKLGVPFEPLVYADPGSFPASFDKGEWDMIVTGKNPHAAKFVDFVSDVMLIDYVYLAGPKCAIDDPRKVDQAGIRIGVPEGASAHAFLSRRLTKAEVVPLRKSFGELVAMLTEGTIDFYASSIEGLQELGRSLPGSRIIGAFETVVFAASMPKGRTDEAREKVRRIVEQAKREGVVQGTIDRLGKTVVRAAPPA